MVKRRPKLPPRSRPREKMDALVSLAFEAARSHVVAHELGKLKGEPLFCIRVGGIQVTGPIRGREKLHPILDAHVRTFAYAVWHVEKYLRDMDP